jgi:hypothetical protein
MDLTPKEMQAQYVKALDKIAEMADHISVLEGERDTALTRRFQAEEALADLYIQLKAEENKCIAAVARTEKAEALLAEATAFSLEPGENSDVWWAFECFHCFHEFGSSGLVFDARLPVSVELPIAKCPRCGTECEFKQSWGATQQGYGARGDGGLVTRVQELEAHVKQQDAALDRRTKALKTLNALPAFQESLLVTSVAPTVDHGAALLNTIAAANDCMFQLEMERHAEALIEDLNTERNWRPYYETELQPLFAALKRLGAPDEPDTELHHQIEWLIERLDKVEAAFARCKIERDRARVFLRERLLVAEGEGVRYVGADAALADEPEQP